MKNILKLLFVSVMLAISTLVSGQYLDDSNLSATLINSPGVPVGAMSAQLYQDDLTGDFYKWDVAANQWVELGNESTDYKGSYKYYTALPTSGMKTGDWSIVRNKISAEPRGIYVWNGTSWKLDLDLSGPELSLSGSTLTMVSNNISTNIDLSALDTDTQLTDAEVKIAYENNANTNAFTDAEKLKLANDLDGDITNELATVTTQATAPTTPKDGDIWFDNSAVPTVMKIWDGTTWVVSPSGGSETVTVDPNAPSSPIEGDTWFDNTNSPIIITRVFNGLTWDIIRGDQTDELAIITSGTTVQRPTTPKQGDVHNNSELGTEFWDGSAWVPSVSLGQDFPDTDETLVYTGDSVYVDTGIIATKNDLRFSSTIFIASSTSSVETKSIADYVCDGISDDIEIQEAVDFASLTGGSVEFSEGDFILDQTVTIQSFSSNGLTIKGQGLSTKIKANNATILFDLINTTYVTGGKRQKLRVTNLSFEDKDNTISTTAIRANALHGLEIDNCFFQSVSITTPTLTTPGQYKLTAIEAIDVNNGNIHNNNAKLCYRGLWLRSDTRDIEDFIVAENNFSYIGTEGIFLDGSSRPLSSKPIQKVTVVNNTMEEDSIGIRLERVYLSNISGNTSTQMLFEAIHLNECDRNVISNNIIAIERTTNLVGIHLTNNSDRNRLTDNTIWALNYTGILIDSGCDKNTIRGNDNYTKSGGEVSPVVDNGLLNTNLQHLKTYEDRVSLFDNTHIEVDKTDPLNINHKLLFGKSDGLATTGFSFVSASTGSQTFSSGSTSINAGRFMLNNTSGDDLFSFDDNTEFMGVGVKNPTERLHVNGRIRQIDITDFSTSTKFAVFGESTKDVIGFRTFDPSITSFLTLTDTEATYTGKAGFIPIVNTAEDALEFVDPNTYQTGTTPPTTNPTYIGERYFDSVALEWYTSISLTAWEKDSNDAGGLTTVTSGTTAQRPTTPKQGDIHNNTDLDIEKTEIFDGTSWIPFLYPVEQHDIHAYDLGDSPFYSATDNIFTYNNLLTTVGAMVIEMPHDWNSTMLNMQFQGHSHNTDHQGAYSFNVGGYNFSGGTDDWARQNWTSTGRIPFDTVRLAFNPVTQKNVLILGDETTIWKDTKIHLANVIHKEIHDWREGWLVDIKTDLTPYTNVVYCENESLSYDDYNAIGNYKFSREAVDVSKDGQVLTYNDVTGLVELEPAPAAITPPTVGTNQLYNLLGGSATMPTTFLDGDNIVYENQSLANTIVTLTADGTNTFINGSSISTGSTTIDLIPGEVIKLVKHEDGPNTYYRIVSRWKGEPTPPQSFQATAGQTVLSVGKFKDYHRDLFTLTVNGQILDAEGYSTSKILGYDGDTGLITTIPLALGDVVKFYGLIR